MMETKNPCRLLASAACCLLAPALGHTADYSVAVTSLQVSRPAVLDPHLFVLGVAEDLSLDFVFPEQEAIRVPVEIEFGVGF